MKTELLKFQKIFEFELYSLKFDTHFPHYTFTLTAATRHHAVCISIHMRPPTRHTRARPYLNDEESSMTHTTGTTEQKDILTINRRHLFAVRHIQNIACGANC